MASMMTPWDLARDFIQNQNQIAAQNRQTADQVAMRTIGAGVDRNVAQVAQGYQQANMGLRNDYATTADTTAYGRQQETTALARQNALTDYGTERKDKLADAAVSSRAALTKDERDFEQLKELERIKLGQTGNGTRRYGRFDGTDQPAPSSGEALTVQRESGGNPNAKNPSSSATGTHQILEGTWNEFADRAGVPKIVPGQPDPRTNPELSSRAYTVISGAYNGELARHNIPVTKANAYAAWFLGPGDAPKVLTAPDDTPLANIVSPATMQANAFLRGMTVADFKRNIEQSHGGGTADASAETGNNGVRRYSDPTNQSTIPNSAGTRESSDDDAVVPVSKGMQEYLDKKGLVADARNAFSQAALERIPLDERENWITDPWTTDLANTPKRETQEYVRVRKKEIDGAGPSLAETVGKKNTTEAKPVEIKTTPKPYMRDGRYYQKLQRSDGTEYEAAVNG